MIGLQIIKMTAGHLEDVLKIAGQCGLGVWSKTDYENELLNESALLFVAQNNQTISGFISARLITSTVEILNIGVLPDFRRQGIGEKLLGIVLQQAKLSGAAESWLEVRAGNGAAQNFYLAKNFKVVGLRRNYYSNPLEDAVLMTSIFSDTKSEKMNIELDAKKILS